MNCDGEKFIAARWATQSSSRGWSSKSQRRSFLRSIANRDLRAVILAAASRPSDVTISMLENALGWDNLRDLPRFRALLEKYHAKT